MEIWFIILISLCVCSLLSSIFTLFRSSTKLPPGPPSIPIITNFLWLRRSPHQFQSLLRSFVAKYGPIVNLRIGSRPTIFIADHSIAHKILVQNGALFAHRPPALPIIKIIAGNQHIISSASYGPLWRLLRRNLTSQILHPSRVRSYSQSRKWVLDILLNRLLFQSESGNPVNVIDHFQYAMFCLLVLLCFGDKLDQSHIREIEDVERAIILGFWHFNVLDFWPKFTKILLRKRWEAFLQLRRNQEEVLIPWQLRRNQEEVLIPLIEARQKANQNRANRDQTEEEKEEFVMSYVDTLLDLELPHEKRKLNDDKMVTLCSEFLIGGPIPHPRLCSG